MYACTTTRSRCAHPSSRTMKYAESEHRCPWAEQCVKETYMYAYMNTCIYPLHRRDRCGRWSDQILQSQCVIPYLQAPRTCRFDRLLLDCSNHRIVAILVQVQVRPRRSPEEPHKDHTLTGIRRILVCGFYERVCIIGIYVSADLCIYWLRTYSNCSIKSPCDGDMASLAHPLSRCGHIIFTHKHTRHTRTNIYTFVTRRCFRCRAREAFRWTDFSRRPSRRRRRTNFAPIFANSARRLPLAWRWRCLTTKASPTNFGFSFRRRTSWISDLRHLSFNFAGEGPGPCKYTRKAYR